MGASFMRIEFVSGNVVYNTGSYWKDMPVLIAYSYLTGRQTSLYFVSLSSVVLGDWLLCEHIFSICTIGVCGHLQLYSEISHNCSWSAFIDPDHCHRNSMFQFLDCMCVCVETVSFRKPHNKYSHGLRSEEYGGHDHWYPNRLGKLLDCVVRMLIKHIQQHIRSVWLSPILLKKYFFNIDTHSLEKGWNSWRTWI